VHGAAEHVQIPGIPLWGGGGSGDDRRAVPATVEDDSARHNARHKRTTYPVGCMCGEGVSWDHLLAGENTRDGRDASEEW